MSELEAAALAWWYHWRETIFHPMSPEMMRYYNDPVTRGLVTACADKAATVDASGPTPPGEGPATGAGGPDAPGASEGLDAAIEGRPASMLTEVQFDYDPDDDGCLPMAKCGCCVDSPSMPEPKVLKTLKCYSPEELAAMRTKAVEQFTAALLTGLDELERDQHRRIGPGDVADLVARVALEVGRA